MKRRICGLIVTLAMVLWVGRLEAHPYELYGCGAEGAAMGSAMTASASGHCALFYNPAGMTLTAPVMASGFTFGVDNVRIRLKERPAGYDLPDVGGSSPKVPSKDRLRSRGDIEDIPNFYGFQVGAVGSFGLENLRIGVSALLPMNRIGRQVSRFSDEREQFVSNNLDFELVGERSQHQVILVGVAHRVLPWLALGGGISVMPEAETVSHVYLDDPARQDEIELALSNDQIGRVSPHAGLLLTPVDGLRIGLSFRGENYFRIGLRNSIQIKGFQGDDQTFPIEQTAEIISSYSPNQISLGVHWHNPAISLDADAVYALWSGYIDRAGEKPVDFQDTLGLRFGVSKKTADGILLRGGLGWQPSPVPEQSGRTNYVDNHRIVASIGGGQPIELFGRKLTASWSVQLHHLLARDVNKSKESKAPVCNPGVTALCDEIADDTPHPETGALEPSFEGLQTGNPGFPGWISSGMLLAVGLDLTWSF